MSDISEFTFTEALQLVTCTPTALTAKYLDPAFVPDPAVRYRWFACPVLDNHTRYATELYCALFAVTRQTEKTEWLLMSDGSETRQLKHAVRKFAHTHPGAALYSFIRKRGRHRCSLANQLARADAIVKAAKALAETTDLSPWVKHPDVGVDYPVPEDYGYDGGW